MTSLTGQFLQPILHPKSNMVSTRQPVSGG